ncbi:MAG: COR domain-containing protein [Blastocatellia bacterium]
MNNQLSELPPVIAELKNLQSLYLSGNQLSELPPVFAELKNLQSLDLSGNQLSELPPVIAELKNLQSLNLSYNQLSELPPVIAELKNLQSLYLSYNKLSELPKDFEAKFGKLDVISLDENQLGHPPQNVADQGLEAILNYLRQETEPLWVSKMVVVGQGRVGKTSLLRCLRDNEFLPDQSSTHGMLIGDLELGHPSEAGVMMKLNTWDFGGQEHYHAPHQYFLTDRALYLIAWNAGQNYKDGGVLYWLDTVTARAPKAKILIVATHVDQREPDLPFESLKEKYKKNVVGQLFRISNKTGEGRDELRQAIAEHAAEINLMGLQWAVPWRKAADALQRKAKKKKRYLTEKEMVATFSRNGVKDPLQQKILARRLHELGEILYFGDNVELKDWIMLNPEWVTKIISRVLDSKEVAENQAVLTLRQRDILWPDIEPPLRDHLLKLMDEFDLSYEVKDDNAKRNSETRAKSLVVELLPQDENRNYHALWDAMPAEPEISMKLQLDRIPPAGIPTWFIAQQHRYTTMIHWRLGALFADPPNKPRHLALLKASPTMETVTLAVRGPFPIDMFSRLKDGLLKTFDRFPGMGFTILIPCKCSKGCQKEWPYEELMEACEQGLPELPCLNNRPFKYAPVEKMLYGHGPVLAMTEQIQRIAEQTDAINSRTQRIESAVEDSHALYQREFTKLFNSIQESEFQSCPNVFALRPGGGDGDLIGLLEPIRYASRGGLGGMMDDMRDRFGRQTMELQLYCQQPGHWHPVGYERGKNNPATGLYQIEVDSEFLQSVGPYLLKLAKIMKYVAPLAGYVLPGLADSAAEEYRKQFKQDVDRWVKLADTASKKAPELLEESSASKYGRSVDAREARMVAGAQLRGLRKALAEKDTAENWGGLLRRMTPEGHWLWLCAEHWEEYR